MNKNYLTTREVCNVLRICSKTLYNYVSEGKLTAQRIGGKLLFDADKIDQILNKN